MSHIKIKNQKSKTELPLPERQRRVKKKLKFLRLMEAKRRDKSLLSPSLWLGQVKKRTKSSSPFKNSRGISLLFVVLITSFILAIGLGISALLIQEMRMMGEIGYSVTAFYAADSGIEEALYDLYTSSTSSPPSPYHSGDLDGAHYDTEAECCVPNSGGCSLEASTSTPSGCPLGVDYIDPNCDALNYCLKSAGSYQKVKRAIEIKY